VRTAKVAIAGRDYIVEALPIRPAREWRELLEGRMGAALAAFRATADLATRKYDDPDALLRDLTNELVTHFGGALSVIVRSVDTIADLLFAYSPALAADRERIEVEGHDEELVEAFAQVLALAYPFGSWIDVAKSLGHWGTTMRKSSSEASTGSGQTSSGQTSAPAS